MQALPCAMVRRTTNRTDELPLRNRCANRQRRGRRLERRDHTIAMAHADHVLLRHFPSKTYYSRLGRHNHGSGLCREIYPAMSGQPPLGRFLELPFNPRVKHRPSAKGLALPIRLRLCRIGMLRIPIRHRNSKT